MATATKSVPSKVPGEPPMPVINIDDHNADMARRQAEYDERCSLEERLKLTRPKYAKEVEDKKPVFKWTVEFHVIERKAPAAPKDKYAADDYAESDDDVLKFRSVTKSVEAQDEREAWAKICDRMEEWPSPKLAKPKFTRGQQANR